jgi:hypothetical protein
VKALNDNPLFFIYAGHGTFNSIAGISFVIEQQDLKQASNTVFPVVFSFACKTGNFAHPQYVSMSESFIRAKNGAVAYFGASIATTTDSDVVMEKKLFSKPFKTNNPSLSAFINSGMKQFAKSHIVNKKVIRNLKSYNLLGDPSLNMKGVKCVLKYEVSLSDTTKTIKQSEFVHPELFSVFKNPDSDEFSLAFTLRNNSFVRIDVNDTLDKRVNNFFEMSEVKAGVYYHNFSLSDLPAGTYRLVYKDNAKTISSIITKR